MLYILTSHTAGRLAKDLKLFLAEVLHKRPHKLVTMLPSGLAPTDVVFSLIPPATLGLRKLRLTQVEIHQATKFRASLKSRVGAPAKLDELYGTFWRSKKLGTMCCISWHPKAGLYAYRTLTARWLRLAWDLAQLSLDGQGNFVHKWRAEYNPPLERLFRSKGLVAYDIETGYPKHENITLFSIGDEFGSASWKWTPEVRQAVTRWMQTPGPKVGHNSFGFDNPRLEEACGVSFVGPLHDTMALVAEFCRQWPKWLQDVAAQFLVVEPWKALYHESSISEEEYSAYDSEACYLVAMELFRLMPALWECGAATYMPIGMNNQAVVK
jgi:hypothetical protein